MNAKHMMNSIQTLFLSLGFRQEVVGENQLYYLRYDSCYCKVTHLEKIDAFVIESADSAEDAAKGILEDGDLYYLDNSEEELLRQLEIDIKAYYM